MIFFINCAVHSGFGLLNTNYNFATKN
uniref:Uncharacterized protein n=1 Tax=Physcomitrium patens TaxID=3218 RepID=A0A2K1KGP6_PHYPA|nr:hypothetical protein PHYPA_009323 [Physcomitrium patens]